MQESTSREIAFDESREEKFKALLSRYPSKEAVLLPALWLAQEQFGALSDEVLEYVAGRLGLAPVRVFATVEFYTMFRRAPAGRYHIQICRNLSCTLNGAEDILALVKEKLGLEPGGRTGDGLFSLELVECLGSCGTAPVMRINDAYYESLDRGKVEQLLELCRRGELESARDRGNGRGPGGSGDES